MTRQELDAALARLGLDVPEAERDGIADAVKYVEQMAASVRKPRSVMAEPAHTVAFPEK
ncbi:MAG TPA: hypothetical protein VET89_05785 [Stellaceae bacterium]|nr:hypothetical protein [Stellaceae bacterium]